MFRHAITKIAASSTLPGAPNSAETMRVSVYRAGFAAGNAAPDSAPTCASME